MEKLIFVGIFLILVGFLFLLASALLSSKVKSEWAVVGFVGPIPIGIGSSKGALLLGVVMALLIIILSVILSKF